MVVRRQSVRDLKLKTKTSTLKRSLITVNSLLNTDLVVGRNFLVLVCVTQKTRARSDATSFLSQVQGSVTKLTPFHAATATRIYFLHPLSLSLSPPYLCHPLSLLSSLLNYPLSRISHIHRYATQFPHYIHIRVHAHSVCPACRNFGLRLSLLSTRRFSRPRTSPAAAAAKSVLASSSVHSVRGGSKGIGSGFDAHLDTTTE